MPVNKKKKTHIILTGYGANELSVSTESSSLDDVCVAVYDPVDDDYCDIRLSWDDVAELKKWLGRRLNERKRAGEG